MPEWSGGLFNAANFWPHCNQRASEIQGPRAVLPRTAEVDYDLYMQTTIDIPDELYAQAESKAAEQGVLLSHVIAQALRLALISTQSVGHQRHAFPLHHSSQPGTLGLEQVQAAADAAALQEDAARVGAL